MKRLVLGVVLLLVLAFVAHEQSVKTSAVVVCGEVHGGGTMTARGVDWAEDFGNWLHELASKPVGPETVKATVEGVEKVLWYWIRTWFLSSKGIQLDPEILQVQQQAEQARQAAEAQCTPCPQALPQDSSPLASLGAAPVTGSPEEVVRQVAARYWPADQVATAVAVAGAESSFNPRASLNYRGEHMRGLWQINDGAHADLIAGKDWADPSVNAYMAHQIWEDAGRKWTPWSTYNSGSYRKFLKPSAATVSLSNSTTPPTSVTQTDGTFTPDESASSGTAPAPTAPANPQNVGCSSEGMPAARIATWNSNHGPTDERVVNGMVKIAKQADIIGGQELSSSVRKARVKDALSGMGWQVTGDHTSHPIYYDAAKFTLVSHDEQKYYTRGDPTEGGDQGDRYVVTAVLRSIAEGKILTVINMHQMPHIQSHGVWNRHQPKRKAIAMAGWGMAMTTARTHMAQGAVVVTMDANWDGDPNGLYKAAGLTMTSQVFGTADTLRHREIDQILYSAGAPASQKELGRFGSDHSARLVTFLASSNLASPLASVAGMRSVTDPTSHKTFQVQIPAGPRGVAINYAIDQLGKRYVWGAHGPNTFDCSGLMSAAWGKAGVKFTPQTESMFREIPHTSSPQPGDITYHPGHVQMVLNDGLILEAANPRVPLRIIDHNWMKPTAYFDPTKMSGEAA